MMNCNDYSGLLEQYLDGSVTPEQLDSMRQHEARCPACAAQRRALDSLQDDLASLKDDVPAMPEGFHQAWLTRVEEDAMTNRERKPRIPQSLTRILSAAAALVFVLGGTLLTRDTLSPSVNREYSAASIYGDYATEESYDAAGNGVMLAAAYDTNAAETGAGAMYARSMKTGAADTAVVREQKIIRSASLTIGTQHYDESLASLRSLCEESGGWTAYSSESVSNNGLRRAYLTLRIPSDQLDAYLESSGSLGRVISKDESATDVTESYYDTQARLETQKALMARLQALVTEAADLSDLLALESQIADTQYMIDSLQSNLNSTDRQVDYATVDVNLREENAASTLTDSDVSLWDRMTGALETGLESFVKFLQDVLVFLAAALPFVAIVCIIWLGVRFILRRRK